ncbi:MAG: helix-turn-helix domain-containing protein [Pseudomonadota bacterium]
MSESKLPSGIDRHVGQRVRWRRRELHLTQEKLGEMLSLTFQQVQKYEKGVNRISAGRLFELAAVLGVPVNYFYDGASQYLPGRAEGVAEAQPIESEVPTLGADALELVTAFQSINDPALRRSLLEMVSSTARALVEEKSEEDQDQPA